MKNSAADHSLSDIQLQRLQLLEMRGSIAKVMGKSEIFATRDG